ncbi:MAG: hypothetical protein IT379_37830 [Deltaproteobacteria bacterium]|nr:hypothetical protein [Deltaproteobacteria bacterium]
MARTRNVESCRMTLDPPLTSLTPAQLQPLSASEVEQALAETRRARLAITERESRLAALSQEADEILRRASRRPRPAAERRELAQRARVLRQEHGQARSDSMEANELEKALAGFRRLHVEGRIEGRPPTTEEADILERFESAGGVVDHWLWTFDAPRGERVWRYVAAGSLWASVLRAGYQDMWPDLALPARGRRLDASELLRPYRRAVKQPPYRLARGSHPNELCRDLVERILRGVSPGAALHAWSDEHPYFDSGKEWWGTLFLTIEVPGGAVGVVASATD